MRLLLVLTAALAMEALSAPAVAQRVAPDTAPKPPADVAWNEIFDLSGGLLDAIDATGAPGSNGIPDAIDRGALHAVAIPGARFLAQPDESGGVRLFATFAEASSTSKLALELSRHLAGRADGDLRFDLRPGREGQPASLEVSAWAVDGASRWTWVPVATTTVGECNEQRTLCAQPGPDGVGLSIEGKLPEGSCHTAARVLSTPAGDGIELRSEGELLTCGLPALFTDRQRYASNALVQIAGRGFRPSVAYEIVVQETAAYADSIRSPGARRTVVADAGGRISIHHALQGARGAHEVGVHAYRSDAPAETDSIGLAVARFLSDSCGDGVPDGFEDCDDGDESANCDDDCTLVQCGDGNVNETAGEACDDGGETHVCDADCTLVQCGDSNVNAAAGEECDEGVETSTCDRDCTAPSCGDGIPNNLAGEQCDDGTESASCDEDCSEATCGDGTPNGEAGEACDDGGESVNCDEDCSLVSCGDSTTNLSAGEDCDDGNTDNSDGCVFGCLSASCGDGYLRSGASAAYRGVTAEDCDDQNTDNDDGCSSSCAVESGWNCTNDPGLTSSCSDIDECGFDSHGCDGNATCNNTSPGYECTCNPGYTGDGVTCTADPTCDDGVQNGDEAGIDCGGSCPNACGTCDDGIQNQGEEGVDCGGPCDACPFCGDGTPNGSEQCDDAGESSACDDDCTAVACGDGNVNETAGEQCDDGNTDDGDGCNATCQTVACGNGTVDAGEQCEDGNDVNTDDCVNCRDAVCGDGFLHETVLPRSASRLAPAAEQCDDGNTNSDDGCDSACQLEVCGDGVRNNGEACDEVTESANCDDDCTLVACSDGNVNQAAGEACDDGNATPGDGCSPSCQTEACGNNVVDGGEQCDDGNTNNSDTCVNCQNAFCGDGYRLTGGATLYRDHCVAGDDCTGVAVEGCDDGDFENGDGCSGCNVDPGWQCTGLAPSVCSDIDECAAGTDNCDANATCTNTVGSFTCTCNAGYTGDGVTCSDIDECAAGTDNCDANATCTNTVGSFTCTCNAGYTGDGVTCSDIDECAAGTDNCDANATCANTAGSFTCACNPGFTGDGVTCTDIDECALGADDCGPAATCENTPGSYDCACGPGVCNECSTAESPTQDPDCSPAACGDGYRNATAGEQCDDSNTANGDGCSATCQNECPNLLQNGEYNAGTASWSSYFSPNTATFSVVAGVARINVATQTNNGQIYQTPVALAPNTLYRVRFRVRNTPNGNDITVQIIKHGSPWTAYFSQAFPVTSAFQDFEATFTSPGVAVNDARFMFFVSPHDSNNSLYEIEFAVLELAACAAPPAAVCGNSVVQAGEQCDDGNASNTDACTNACLNASCGDGFVQSGVETCDDGNTANGDGCSSTCQNEPGGSCPNLVPNGNFAGGTSGWSSFFNPAASFNVVGGVARVTIPLQTSNGQIYRAPIALEPNTQYRVRFRARNTKGDNLTVQVIKNVAPFTGYGSQVFDLTSVFQNLEFTFTTPGVAIPDARLMFFFSPHDTNGTQYEIDDVVLERVTCI